MDEELGYSKYDYCNKETDNSRNGHSQKTGYTGALKAPVRCFGNHLSEKRKSLFRTDDLCGGAAILKK